MKRAIFAAYHKGECVIVGTVEEVAKYCGVKPSTVQWGATQAAQKRFEGRKNVFYRYYHAGSY